MCASRGFRNGSLKISNLSNEDISAQSHPLNGPSAGGYFKVGADIGHRASLTGRVAESTQLYPEFERKLPRRRNAWKQKRGQFPPLRDPRMLCSVSTWMVCAIGFSGIIIRTGPQ